MVSIIGVLSFTVMSQAATNTTEGNSTAEPDFLRCEPGKPSFFFILRQDFTDISLFDCPDPQNLKNAVGSRVSLTFDEIAHATAVSVDGLAAGVVRYPGNEHPFLGIAFGPYIQGSEMYQFKSATTPSKSVDALTAGGFTEFGFENPFDPLAADYFRLRGGEAFGNSGIGWNTFVGEWIPVYGGPLKIGTSYFIPRTILGFQYSPEVMLQYDQLQYGPMKYLLFSTNSDALRIGPEVVLKLFLDARNISNPTLHMIADQTTLSITYHASWDAYSGRDYSWLQSTLTYNLDPDGHIALSASYGYGNSEMTANMTSQLKLGLAGKF